MKAKEYINVYEQSWLNPKHSYKIDVLEMLYDLSKEIVELQKHGVESKDSPQN